jgi:hypothetical protein
MKSRRHAAGSERFGRSSFFFAVWCLLPAAYCPAADAPVFVLQSVRDDLPTGPLTRLTADGAVQIGAAPAIAEADVVALRRRGLPPPHFPHTLPHVRLANGDRIPGRIQSIENDKLHFLADLGTTQEITLPVSALTAIWLTDAAAAWAATPAGIRTLAEKRRQDIVQLTNGDAITGTVIAWPADGPLRIDAAGREIALPRDRVRSIMFSTDLARGAKPRSAFRQITLLNGARLSVRSAELVGDNLRTTTLTGASVRLPLQSVAAVSVYQGRAVYLSDLKPRAYAHTSYLGVDWQFAVDHNVSGGDLRLGGGTYDKGVGLHSRSRVTFALPPGARRFEAVVGLDEMTGRSGAVMIDVLADGKSLFDTRPELTGTEPPKSLRLPLPTGARDLTLVVDYGRGGDVQDQVDWAEARVISGGAGGP